MKKWTYAKSVGAQNVGSVTLHETWGDSVVMKKKPNTAALYMRLSREDENNEGESNSITNQRKVLVREAAERGYTHTEEYIDDGITGTSFDRPEFMRMERDIEAGKISAVIVKDLSRIGRSHIKVGLFTETFLLEHDVRLIAVHDNVDSDTGDNEFAAIRNVFNEMYARDASKKVRNACRTRALSGEPIGRAPYGYAKDPLKKSHWIIDSEAAATVQRIFALTLEGKGASQIADILTSDKVLTPKNYLVSKGEKPGGIPANSDPYCWRHPTVISIITRQEYCGDVVNFKSKTRIFGSKKRKNNAPEDYVIFKDVHEPIISREDFERAQAIRAGAPRRDCKSGKNIFSGLLRCPDCGSKLSFHVNTSNNELAYYNCHNNNSPKSTCASTHYVRADFLEKAILAELRNVSSFAKTDEEAFAKQLMESVGALAAQKEKALKTQLSRIQARIKELKVLFKRAYEDSTLGELARESMLELVRGYEDEQKDLQTQELLVEQRLSESQIQGAGMETFMALIKKHARIKKLTPAILNKFIDHIDVHQAQKEQGRWIQRLDIYYNFVGKLSIPDGSKAKKVTQMDTRKGVKLELNQSNVERLAS